MSNVKNILAQVIRNEVQKVAADPKTDMTQRDVGKVVAELAPVIAHATNNEPWYQSRVTIGSIVTIVASVATALGYTVDVPTWTQLAILVVPPIAGAAYALWGRWVSTKPVAA